MPSYYSRMLHILNDLDCSWEFLTTLNFDWEYLSGKRAFHWLAIVRLYQVSCQQPDSPISSLTSGRATAVLSRSSWARGWPISSRPPRAVQYVPIRMEYRAGEGAHKVSHQAWYITTYVRRYQVARSIYSTADILLRRLSHRLVSPLLPFSLWSGRTHDFLTRVPSGY